MIYNSSYGGRKRADSQSITAQSSKIMIIIHSPWEHGPKKYNAKGSVYLDLQRVADTSHFTPIYI